MSFVVLDQFGPIAVLTINRPEKLNALNLAVLRDLDSAVAKIAQAAGLRCLLVTGTGDKAFVAGADIGEMQGLSEASAREFSRFGNEVFRRLAALPLPTLAAVNGYAFGGGCELALCCDLRVAAENAQFAFPETSLGIIPGFGGTQRLARVVGYARAAKMIFSGERVGAAEALAAGLVEEIAPKEAFRERVLALARTIASNGPVAVGAAKRVMRLGIEGGIDAGLSLETEAFAEVFGTKDRAEGFEAFLAKRERKFIGA